MVEALKINIPANFKLVQLTTYTFETEKCYKRGGLPSTASGSDLRSLTRSSKSDEQLFSRHPQHFYNFHVQIPDFSAFQSSRSFLFTF